MTKTRSNATRARYTLEFKLKAVRMIDKRESIAAAARSLGVVDQTLFNWVKLHKAGKLGRRQLSWPPCCLTAECYSQACCRLALPHRGFEAVLPFILLEAPRRGRRRPPGWAM